MGKLRPPCDNALGTAKLCDMSFMTEHVCVFQGGVLFQVTTCIPSLDSNLHVYRKLLQALCRHTRHVLPGMLRAVMKLRTFHLYLLHVYYRCSWSICIVEYSWSICELYVLLQHLNMPHVHQIRDFCKRQRIIGHQVFHYRIFNV